MQEGTLERIHHKVSGMPLFQRMPRAAFFAIMKIHPPLQGTFARRSIVHLPDEVCTRLEVVLEGRIAVQRMDAEGRILTIDVLGPGDVLGANLLFSSRRRYPMQVVAEEASVLLRFSREAILAMSGESAPFTEDLLRLVSDRSVHLSDKIHTVAHKGLRQRIEEFLRLQYHLQGSKTLRLPMSKKELAERLGVERTSLSRGLSKMRAEGLLEYDARHVVLKSLGNIFEEARGTDRIRYNEENETGGRWG